jgi:hypothetical protein
VQNDFLRSPARPKLDAARLASEGASFASGEPPTSTGLSSPNCWSTRSMRLESAIMADHEAPKKVLELKLFRRLRIDRNYQLVLKVKSEAAARFAAQASDEGVWFGECLERMLEVYEASRKGKSDDHRGT